MSPAFCLLDQTTEYSGLASGSGFCPLATAFFHAATASSRRWSASWDVLFLTDVVCVARSRVFASHSGLIGRSPGSSGLLVLSVPVPVPPVPPPLVPPRPGSVGESPNSGVFCNTPPVPAVLLPPDPPRRPESESAPALDVAVRLTTPRTAAQRAREAARRFGRSREIRDPPFTPPLDCLIQAPPVIARAPPRAPDRDFLASSALPTSEYGRQTSTFLTLPIKKLLKATVLTNASLARDPDQDSR